MKSLLKTALIAIGLILSISVNGQETTTRGTIQETEGNIVVLLETASWGQNYPFNNQCWTKYGGTTHAKTGCVATAYAIVLRYHCYPTEGTENKLYNCQSGEVMTDRVYDWDNMPLVYDGNWNETQIYEVSKIMSHLAHAHTSTFGAGGTTANEERETAKLNRFFNYPKIAASYQREFTQSEWEAKIRESLDNGCPIPYAANNSGTGDSRHMFVIDGYTDNGYYHFNFGWNGSCNGWFKLDDITPSQGDNYSWKEGSDHYANFNLMPDVARHTVTATVAPANAGTVAINKGTADNDVTADLFEGTLVTLTAKANDGYAFSHWSKSEEIISTENTFKATVGTDNNDYVANFTVAAAPVVAEYEISPSTGTLNNGTSKSSVWTFTTTDEFPAELTITATSNSTAVNAISINSGKFKYYAHAWDNNDKAYTNIQYTLSVPEGYIISEYKMIYWVSKSQKGKVTVKNEKGEETPTDSDDHDLSATPNRQTTEFALITTNGSQEYITIESFIVKIQKEGGSITEINVVENIENNAIYNLRGVRLDAIIEPGIYIINGKKILKK